MVDLASIFLTPVQGRARAGERATRRRERRSASAFAQAGVHCGRRAGGCASGAARGGHATVRGAGARAPLAVRLPPCGGTAGLTGEWIWEGQGLGRLYIYIYMLLVGLGQISVLGFLRPIIIMHS
jgi:hypothetical protein